MTRIILLGVGPLGIKVARFILERPNLALVGLVDVNPTFAGRPANEFIEGAPAGLAISASLDDAITGAIVKPDVAVVTTVSSIRRILPTIREVASRGLPIVTTCEELSYPWRRHPEEAAEIDRVCRSHGVACLATGVNPGFLMDYLPSVLSSIHQRIDHVLVERVQDASVRRVPFQKKIGAGLSLAQYQAAKADGTLRHVGLPESLDMIADAIGWELEERSETLEPVLAAADLSSGYKPIRKGEPSGVEQIATGTIDGREVIRLCFRAAVGEESSYDRIAIAGDPGAEMTIKGGVNGDIATCAIATNAIRSVLRANPGLRTMLDVPVPSWFCGRTREAAGV
jgi:2,4-diaminopentanoate dehydrogenase